MRASLTGISPLYLYMPVHIASLEDLLGMQYRFDRMML